MKNLHKIIFAFCFAFFLLIGLKFFIIPYENKTYFKEFREVKNYWLNVDTKNLIGKPLDGCLCTEINGKIYKANPKIKTTFTYTPLDSSKINEIYQGNTSKFYFLN